MSSLIEIEFRKLCHESEAHRHLLAQWEYAKKIATSALPLIGHSFPHYSQHDASHSETILNRISSMLGEKIKTLSATDLWLLLSGAYFHDLGMVSLHARRDEDLRSPEFASFVDDCVDGSNEDLQVRARRLQELRPAKDYAELSSLNEDLKLVYAEYVRPKHAARAAEALENSKKFLGQESPGSLLPARFDLMLREITEAHGRDLDWIVSKLTQRQNGIGNDYCHPRFAACMLRLGDLLDLDDGRFCPALGATLKALPPLSEAHSRKHQGITSILVTERRIDVTGEYDDPEAYFEASSWFEMLRKELQDQQGRWSDLRAEKIDGLPSAGKIEASLTGHITLEPGKRPTILPDPGKMLELIRGANLYAGPEDVVREILQNAIDATLLRYAYVTEPASYADNPDDLKRDFEQSNWPIRVSLRLVDATKDPVTYEVQIDDCGIGMNLTDLKGFLSPGSRSAERDKLRRKLKRGKGNNDDWRAPSGTFGIGFQSIFLYADVVTISTRHVDGPSAYQIKIQRKNARAYEVSIKESKREIGTTVIWNISVPRNPPIVVDEDFNSPIDGFDFLRNDDTLIAASPVYRLVRKMQNRASVRILTPGEINEFNDSPTADPKNSASAHFAHGLRAVLLGVTDDIDTPCRTPVFFRGAPVSSSLRLELLELELDIWTGDARSLLELSRRKLTDAGETKLHNLTSKILPNAIQDWIGSASPDEQKALSLFAKLNKIHVPANFVELWREAKADNILLKDMMSAEEVRVVIDPTIRSTKSVSLEKGGVEYHVHSESSILVRLLKLEGYVPELIRCDTPSKPTYLFKEGGRYAIQEDVFAVVFFPRRGFFGSRTFCPAIEDFSELAVPKNVRMPGSIYNTFLAPQWMVNPFKIEANSELRLPPARRYVDWLIERKREAGDSIDVQKICDALTRFVRILLEQWRRDEKLKGRVPAGIEDEFLRHLHTRIEAERTKSP